MKFIFLFGPQAVGKMTVGHELEKITNLKLFHNHMTIDLLHPFFGYSPDLWRLTNMFREEIFKTVAKSELEGVIFTFVWSFESQEDWKFVEETKAIFESAGAEVFFVELEADIKERLLRNRTPHRLEHKPTKRNIQESEGHLLKTNKKYRLNSLPNEIQEKNYLRFDNTSLQAAGVASIIKNHFSF